MAHVQVRTSVHCKAKNDRHRLVIADNRIGPSDSLRRQRPRGRRRHWRGRPLHVLDGCRRVVWRLRLCHCSVLLFLPLPLRLQVQERLALRPLLLFLPLLVLLVLLPLLLLLLRLVLRLQRRLQMRLVLLSEPRLRRLLRRQQLLRHLLMLRLRDGQRLR